ncbi:hypothetical protein B0H10DRAFT_1939396 [Mycena sp. CBHHK59/15]|nr:hypothetical protein B0H10DRAFT_1939396 [Mycena sp. CBHHK59/15]
MSTSFHFSLVLNLCLTNFSILHLLINEYVDVPLTVWDMFQQDLAYDFTLRNNNVLEIGLNLAFADLSHLLEEYGKDLSDFGLLEATVHTQEALHDILQWGQVANQLASRAENTGKIFKREQISVCTAILSAILENREDSSRFEVISVFRMGR